MKRHRKANLCWFSNSWWTLALGSMKVMGKNPTKTNRIKVYHHKNNQTIMEYKRGTIELYNWKNFNKTARINPYSTIIKCKWAKLLSQKTEISNKNLIPCYLEELHFWYKDTHRLKAKWKNTSMQLIMRADVWQGDTTIIYAPSIKALNL